MRATIAAVEAPAGEIYNVGGEAATVWDVLRRLETLAGRRRYHRLEHGRPGNQASTPSPTRPGCAVASAGNRVSASTRGWPASGSGESGLEQLRHARRLLYLSRTHFV